MATRGFRQVDVFTEEPYRGNPLAVVLDGNGLSDQHMRRFARWTNLSETVFVLPPTEASADYWVRIFTPVAELPFAGHPTLGTCHAWLEAGGVPRRSEVIVQQCSAGLISIRRTEEGLAFQAPPLVRSGPVDAALASDVVDACGIDHSVVVAAEWVDNGPGWLALLLDSVESVLAVKPAFIDQGVGLAGQYPAGSPFAIEVRAFFPKDGAMAEDPVTGSLNASLAQWLLASGRLSAPYVSSQGTAMGRTGRVHVSVDGAGVVWVGGRVVTCVAGTVTI